MTHHNEDGLLYNRGLIPNILQHSLEIIRKDEIHSDNIPNADPDVIVQLKMYYYSYDREDGVGFYPQISTANDSVIYISFKLFTYNLNAFGWIQHSGPAIYGFIKRHGIEILNALNEESNQNAIVISNSGGRIIFPMMYNSTYYILENYSK